MNPIRINIPTRLPHVTQAEDDAAFALNLWRAIQELGIDPKRVGGPMLTGCAKKFRDGSWTKAEFQHAANNIAILRGLK